MTKNTAPRFLYFASYVDNEEGLENTDFDYPHMDIQELIDELDVDEGPFVLTYRLEKIEKFKTELTRTTIPLNDPPKTKKTSKKGEK